MAARIARPDRYADAVRGRRAELRDARALLVGGHRAELRSHLAACRVTASAELGAVLADLAREVRGHADRADRAGRAAFPAQVRAAVIRCADGAGPRWAAIVVPGVRRVAAAHGCRWSGEAVAAVLRRGVPVAVPGPEPPPGVLRALLAGATEGTWRVALLPAAVLPAVGLPAVVGRSVLPLAVGLGLTLLTAAVHARRTAADRARLRRWGGEVVASVRAALETALARALLDVERLAVAELDAAVARRRAAVDAELRALAPDPVGAG